MIRTLRPTDLTALVSLAAQSPGDEVRPKGRLEEKPLRSSLLDIFLQQWEVGRRRWSWIGITRGGVDGFLSMRGLAGPGAWEVDCLVLAPSSGSLEVALSLLGAASLSAGQRGVKRLYIRFPSDSSLLDSVQQSGFVPYIREVLYRSVEPISPLSLPSAYMLRRRASEDDHSLFHLYLEAVPGAVRRGFGMTLDEWQEAFSVVGRGYWERLCFKDGALVGWLGVVKRGKRGLVDVMSKPGEDEVVPFLLGQGASAVEGEVLVWAPHFHGRLRQVLEENAFESLGECTALVKSLAARVTHSGLVPAHAGWCG